MERHLQQDVSYRAPLPATEILSTHRRSGEADIYFLNSRSQREQEVEVTLRAEGRVPELWRAETGAVEPVTYRIANGETIVSIRFMPQDAVFLVLRHPSLPGTSAPTISKEGDAPRSRRSS